MSKTPESGTDFDWQWPENHPRHDADRETQPLHLREEEHHNRKKYHKHAIFLLVAYVPLITIPWALTCVMARRPLTASSFHIQVGLSQEDISRFRGWMTAVNVFNSIASLITIPVLSALIAQAAAVYSQKYRVGQGLHLNHLVALADRGWTNPSTLKRSWAWRHRGSKGVRNFLYLAAIVILLGSIQQPLYQVLVPTESILIPTCQDAYYMRNAVFKNYEKAACSYRKAAPRVQGWDIEPAEMNRIPHNAVSQKLTADLALVSLNDVKPHLWSNRSNPEADKQALKNLYSESFIASLEQGTTTGVLREHTMRLNSSLNCESIQRSQFPSSCGGENPFTRSFSHGNNLTRVCVPGRFGLSPWTLSRNRQDIIEELYLDVLEEVPPDYTLPQVEFLSSNYTLHCTASTTRGYFELGNYRNNYTWGPLLETWPGREEMMAEFNDYLYMHNYSIPSEFDNITLSSIWDDDWLNSMYSDAWSVSGPLTMAAISIFGNKTFFDSAILAWNDTINPNDTKKLPYQQICSIVPFSRLAPDEYDPNTFPACYAFAEQTLSWKSLKDHLFRWLQGFNDTQTATTALSTAVFLANEAVLTMDQWNEDYTPDESGHYNRAGRIIYSGVGASVHKPKLSIAATATITSVLFLQLLGLALLTWLIYRGPSETRSLDVMTFSRLMASTEEDQKEANL